MALAVDEHGIDFQGVLEPGLGFIPWNAIKRIRRVDGAVTADSRGYRVPYLALDVVGPKVFKQKYPTFCNFRGAERKKFFRDLGVPYADFLVPEHQLPCKVDEFLNAVTRIKQDMRVEIS